MKLIKCINGPPYRAVPLIQTGQVKPGQNYSRPGFEYIGSVYKFGPPSTDLDPPFTVINHVITIELYFLFVILCAYFLTLDYDYF